MQREENKKLEPGQTEEDKKLSMQKIYTKLDGRCFPSLKKLLQVALTIQYQPPAAPVNVHLVPSDASRLG